MIQIIIMLNYIGLSFQGVWNVEGAEVALGAESVDRNFRASQLMATEESIPETGDQLGHLKLTCAINLNSHVLQ